MKISRSLILLAAGLIASASASAKPPLKSNTQSPAASPAPAATPDESSANPTATWLLRQDGQDGSITLPLREVVHAATGKNVLPFDPADPADKAFLARLGSVMDRVLPRINHPDSAPQTLSRLEQATDEIVTQIEVEIAGDWSGSQSAGDRVSGRGYPTFRLIDKQKPYYLAVVLHSPGKEEMASRSLGPDFTLRLDPTDPAYRIGTDGCCLLIGIQYELTPKGTLAFLNWDIVDVSNVPVHAAITFKAAAADVYHPGAILTDGRKGTD